MAILSSLSPSNNTVITTNSATISTVVNNIQNSSCIVYLEVSSTSNFSSLFSSQNTTITTSGSTASFTVSGFLQGNYYWRMKVVDGTTSPYTSYYGLFVNISNTITGRFSPDAIQTQTNLTGSLSNITDDPDTPDANWLTATAGGNTTLKVSFPTPSYNLKTGAGLQELRVQVRESSTGATPTVKVSLYENGTLISSSASTSVTSATGQIVSFTFDASTLSNINGSGVECQIDGTSVTSKGKTYSVEIGAVEWNYQSATTLQTQTNAPADVAPADVSGLADTVTETYVNLTWSSPSDSDFYYVEVYRDSALVNGFYRSTSYKDSTVSTGTTYQYEIITVDVTGNKSAGVTVSATTPIVAPIVTVISIDKGTISNETGMDTTVITFTFNVDVTQWTCNVLGSDPTTGKVADSGGAVTKNTNITATIDWTELYQEGSNQVNIYGQAGGIWTPYDDSSVYLDGGDFTNVDASTVDGGTFTTTTTDTMDGGSF